MKTKVCYFCNSILNERCQACKDKYDLDHVYTSYIVANNNGYWRHYYSVIEININEIHYRVKLIFLDFLTLAPVNETKIYVNYKHILTLPGYPFTPANVQDKLKTYLIFS